MTSISISIVFILCLFAPPLIHSQITCDDSLTDKVKPAVVPQQLQVLCKNNQDYVIAFRDKRYQCVHKTTCEPLNAAVRVQVEQQQMMVKAPEYTAATTKAEDQSSMFGFLSPFSIFLCAGAIGIAVYTQQKVRARQRVNYSFASMRSLLSDRYDLEEHDQLHQINPFCSNAIPMDEEMQLMGENGEDDPSQRF